MIRSCLRLARTVALQGSLPGAASMGVLSRTRFTEANMNPLAREMQYAVRGAIVTRADQVSVVVRVWHVCVCIWS